MKDIKNYIRDQREITNSNKNNTIGVTTGLDELDLRTSGYKDKELNLIASRIGYGKTSLALTGVIANLNDNNGVLYFSMDLLKDELLTKIISMKSGISLPLLKRGMIDEEREENFNKATKELSEQKLFIDDTKYCDINYIKNKSKEMINNNKNNIKMIIIDYFDLIENNSNKNIARELKKLAIKLDIPIVILSQLSNKIEKRDNQKPILSDIKDNNLEIESDTIMFIYVYDYVLQHTEDAKELKSIVTADITVAKQLNGISGYSEKYSHNRETCLFYKEFTPDISDMLYGSPGYKKLKELEDFREGYKYSNGLPYYKNEHEYISVIDAYKLKLKKIPTDILELKQLEILRIQNNKIKYLPMDISTCEKLEALCLCDNRLKMLPDNLPKLKNLNELGICNNSTLLKLPDNFGELKLTTLSIDGNLLNKYINTIMKITTLKELDIHGGFISKKVLRELTKLPNLKELTFESIDNKKFPKKVGRFDKIEYFTIKESSKFRLYNNNINSDLFSRNIISLEINRQDLLGIITTTDLSFDDIPDLI